MAPLRAGRREAQAGGAQAQHAQEEAGPVLLARDDRGRAIAKSFWGKAWCDNLERYSDFESRLPRGRTYVRNGSVLDLQIRKGEIAATVAGSELYTIGITVAPVAAARWKAICRDCAGRVDSLVELLQGRLSKGVMDRVCRSGDGLFPAPKEIRLSCSCPDWADMCKHVAAVLYGVGARLDEHPELLFALRDVDEHELLAGAGGEDLGLVQAAPGAGKVLEDGDLAALFGLEIAETAPADAPEPAVPQPLRKRSEKKGLAGKKWANKTYGLAAARRDRKLRAGR
jgi:uncharacterized Zn finger protein